MRQNSTDIRQNWPRRGRREIIAKGNQSMSDHHDHETMKVEGCPFTEEGEALDIDVLLAPLIRELWRLEIETEQCCQEEWPGLASIVFPGTGEATDFLWVAQENYK